MASFGTNEATVVFAGVRKLNLTSIIVFGAITVIGLTRNYTRAIATNVIAFESCEHAFAPTVLLFCQEHGAVSCASIIQTEECSNGTRMTFC